MGTKEEKRKNSAANQQRKETRKATQERHAKMRCRVLDLKIRVKNHSRKDYLKRLFLEAKWFTNDEISQRKNGTKWSEIDEKTDTVPVKTPVGVYNQNLVFLSSQMKQGIKDRLKANEKSIITNIKNKNIKHGELHYVSDVNSIPLKQYGVTYRFSDDYKKVYFQGHKELAFRVMGYRQLPGNAEIANAVLVKRYDGYHLLVTIFVPWEKKSKKKPDVGLDFGIINNITTSDSVSLSWCFEETEALKKAQAANLAFREWSRKHYGYALNSKKQLGIIRREYYRMGCRKVDSVNKFVGALYREYDVVCVQDENLKGWLSGRFGRCVQHSIMGGIMKRLKERGSTVIISAGERTSSVCPFCGHVLEEKLTLSERVFVCPVCNSFNNRDVAAARVILATGLGVDIGNIVVSESSPLLKNPSRLGEQVVIRQLSPEAQVL